MNYVLEALLVVMVSTIGGIVIEFIRRSSNQIKSEQSKLIEKIEHIEDRVDQNQVTLNTNVSRYDYLISLIKDVAK